MTRPSLNAYALIYQEPQSSSDEMIFEGLVGEVKEIDNDEEKALLDPNYRIQDVESSSRDPLRTERIWIRFDNLVTVLKRKDTIQLNDSKSQVEIRSIGSSSYFSVEKLY